MKEILINFRFKDLCYTSAVAGWFSRGEHREDIGWILRYVEYISIDLLPKLYSSTCIQCVSVWLRQIQGLEEVAGCGTRFGSPYRGIR